MFFITIYLLSQGFYRILFGTIEQPMSKGEGIESNGIRVRLDPIEYDVGIKAGGFSLRENVDYEV
jgi:hypothetical protein